MHALWNPGACTTPRRGEVEQVEQWISVLFQKADPFLIRLFHLADDPLAGFLIGSCLLAMACVVVGEVTLSLAIRWNRQHIEALKQEIRRNESLSIQAYEMGDRISYQALNKAANDAWGRHFFSMAAYSAGVLWPIPFALGWMQIHFAQTGFPVIFPLSLVVGKTVGYPFVFIPIYILARILFKYLHPWLPYFASVHKMLNDDRQPAPARSSEGTLPPGAKPAGNEPRA
jgi:hypothetical protein